MSDFYRSTNNPTEINSAKSPEIVQIEEDRIFIPNVDNPVDLEIASCSKNFSTLAGQGQHGTSGR